jgi:hypothetical protein
MRDSGLGATTSSNITNIHRFSSEIHPKNYSYCINRDSRHPKGNSEIDIENRGSLLEHDKMSQKSFEGQNFLSSQARKKERERSPFRDKGTKMDNFIKSHSKCLEINNLAI